MSSDHDLRAAFAAEEKQMDEVTRRLRLLAHDHFQRLRALGHEPEWGEGEIVEATIRRALDGRLREHYSDRKQSLFGFLALALLRIAETGKPKGH